MSLKQEIETWVAALGRYDNNEFDEALAEFEKISDTSKIHFNMGVTYATLGEHEKAVECYQRAIALDQYLAVAYFQQGVSNFLLGDFEEALANFNDTLLYLRGNTIIDYAQLGLLFKLYSCEVLFNRGLCYIYLQQRDAGMQDLSYAWNEKQVDDHDVIKEALDKGGEGFTVFSIPVGVVYRPNEAKVRNLKTKDYLGKPRLVATANPTDTSTSFAGTDKREYLRGEGPKDDRPAEQLSFAASNLVKPNLQSRNPQAKPPNNTFPPTPPPENDRQAISRAASVRSGLKPMPPKLNIEKARPSDRYERERSPQDRRPQPSRAPSAPPSRAYSTREPQRRRRSAQEEDGYLDDFIDNYGDNRGSGRRGSQPQRRQPYIEEEEDGDDYEDGSVDMNDFDMLPRRPGSNSMSSSRTVSRRPEMEAVSVSVYINKIGNKMERVLLTQNMKFDQFKRRIEDEHEDNLVDSRGNIRQYRIRFQDEDGEMVSIRNDNGLELAYLSAVAQKKQSEATGLAKLKAVLQLQ